MNKPLVGKIEIKQDNTVDFAGHEMKWVEKKDEWGHVYFDVEFDTSAFGVFTSAKVESIDGIEYIISECELWDRFSNAYNLILDRIKQGTLYTSWEISVSESHDEEENGSYARVIDNGKFEGHCLLAKDVEPAYDSSKLLDVATKQSNIPIQDNEITQALLKDMIEMSSVNINDSIISQEQEEQSLKNKPETQETIKVDEVIPETKVVSEVVESTETTTSELDKLTLLVSELNANLILKNDALVKAAEIIENLKSEVSELTKYKEMFDASEQERIEKENAEKQENLKAYAMKTKLFKSEEFDEDENLKTLISNLDEKEIKSIIADRLAKSLDDIVIETSTVIEKQVEKIVSNLNNDDDVIINKGKTFFNTVMSV